MEKILEEYRQAAAAYSSLTSENKEKINRLIVETLAKQQSQRQ